MTKEFIYVCLGCIALAIIWGFLMAWLKDVYWPKKFEKDYKENPIYKGCVEYRKWIESYYQAHIAEEEAKKIYFTD